MERNMKITVIVHRCHWYSTSSSASLGLLNGKQKQRQNFVIFPIRAQRKLFDWMTFRGCILHANQLDIQRVIEIRFVGKLHWHANANKDTLFVCLIAFSLSSPANDINFWFILWFTFRRIENSTKQSARFAFLIIFGQSVNCRCQWDAWI